MRRLIADLVFPIHSPEIEQGMLLLDAQGTVVDVLKPGDSGYDHSNAERLNGWLVPGFVNAHCHLELSHLKGKLREKMGLDGFVEELMEFRPDLPENIQQAMRDADSELAQNGIVAVGDISNGSSSFGIKAESEITYYTFVERFGLDPQKASASYQSGIQLLELLGKNPKNRLGNLSPHAPYSVSPELFELISDQVSSVNGILSIHNQETQSENELFQTGRGKMHERLLKMGIVKENFSPSGKTSVETVLKFFPASAKIQLVHNTCTSQKDLYLLETLKDRLYLCLCPGANLYIENQLPDISLFWKNGFTLTVGTDSLASNNQLSILNELLIIQNSFPEIPVSELFSWASLNGAKLLGLEKELGSFQSGKHPGVMLIQGVDTKEKRILPTARVIRY
jgi:cytosine/adenosine deaminase-related metal-dependent hydrolase